MRRTAEYGALLIVLIISISAYSREKAEIVLSDPLGDMISAVIDAGGKDSVSKAIPTELMDIVEEFYADEIVSDSIPIDVLSYLDGIYKEHDYYESGGWVSSVPNFEKYIPYSGQLPEYEIKDFVRPVEGKVNSGYGYRPRFRRYHRGVDISLNTGDTVKCALPGVVVKIGYDHKGYGSYVVVAHSGNLETLYGHLNRSLVMPGYSIEGGEPLGIGGNTGNSTGPHLHFETRYLGMPMDPVPWFNLKE